ncbi:hypothetical protein Mpal_1088 [Methanosphaerula palustris E1-9c]|uniref:Uncharacterized protein n=1 Tax=Methanosphaerula palustris (strain ATCC BAA-1556 / DSM 19958 / E1-9c) TaxID=521011 RepID=B8GH29_METPE|nr:hypothetical protein Mpal_1088 [Methanosphaerula palustris E1-9c]
MPVLGSCDERVRSTVRQYGPETRAGNTAIRNRPMESRTISKRDREKKTGKVKT